MTFNAGTIDAELRLDGRDTFTAGLRAARREVERFERPVTSTLRLRVLGLAELNRLNVALARVPDTITPRVRLDLGRSLTDAARLDAALRGVDRTVRARAVVDVDTAAVDALDAQLVALGQGTTTVRVRTDLGRSLAELSDLAAALAGIRALSPLTVKIDLDGLGPALAGLAALAAAATALGALNPTVDVDVDIAAALAQIAALQAALAGLSGATVGGGAGGPGGLGGVAGGIGLIGAAAAAAAPLIGLLAAAVAALPAAIGLAAGPIAAIALGMDGIKKAAEGLAKPVADLKASLAAQWQSGLTPVLTELRAVFPVLQQGLGLVVGSLVGIADAVTKVITSAAGLAAIRDILAGVSQFLSAIAPAIALFVDNFLLLAQIGVQALGPLADALNAGAAGFRGMLDEANRSGVLIDAMRGLGDIVGAVLEVFNEFVGVGLTMFAQLAGPLATTIRLVGDVLEALAPILTAVSKMFLDILNPALAALVPIFNALAPSLVLMADLIGSTLGEALRIATPLLVDIARAVGTLLLEALNAIKPVLPIILDAFRLMIDAVRPLVPILVDLGVALIRELAPVLPILARAFLDIVTAIVPLIEPLGQIVKDLIPPMVAVLPELVPVVGALATAFVALVRAAVPIIPPLLRIVAALLPAAAALLPVVARLLADVLVPAIVWVTDKLLGFLGGVADAAEGLAGFVEDAKRWVGDFAAAIPGKIQEVIDWFTRLGEDAQRIAGEVGTWFAELPGRIGDALSGAVGAVGTWLADLGATIRDGAIEAWNNLVTAAQDAGVALGTWLADLPFTIARGLGELAGTLYRAATEGWASFTEGIATAWNDTVAWFEALPQRITDLVTDAGTWLTTSGTDTLNGFNQGLYDAWTAVSTWFTELPGKIGAFFTDAGTWLTTSGTDALNGFNQGLYDAWNATVTWFEELPAKIEGFFTGVNTWLYDTGTDLWNGLHGAVTTAWEDTQTWFEELPGKIDTFFTDAGTWLTDAGNNILQGLLDGLNSKWKEVVGFFTRLVDEFVAGFKDAAGIASPSTVFYAAAVDIMQGLLNGAASMLQSVIDFFVNMGTTISENFRESMLNMQKWATEIWGQIAAFFTDALARFTTSWTDTWTGVQVFFTETWQNLQRTAQDNWNAIRSYFAERLAEFTGFWRTTWENISTFFTELWGRLRTTAEQAWANIRAFFEGAFASFGSYFRTTWTNLVGDFERIWAGLTDIASRVWAGVRGAFTTGVNSVIDIINKFAGTINKVAGMLGFSINLNVDRLAEGGPVGVRPPGGTVPAFARGGSVPGWGPGIDDVPAVLSRGEHVITPTEVRGAGGHAAIHRVRQLWASGVPAGDPTPAMAYDPGRYAMGGAVRGGDGWAAAGPLPRFAGGGAVWEQLWAAVKGQFANAVLSSSVRPGSVTRSGGQSYHATGRAIDVTGPMMAINRWIAGAYPNSTELIYTPGINIHNGRPHTYSPGVQSDHYDHVHWAMAGGIDGTSSAGGGFVQQLLTPIIEGLLRPMQDALRAQMGPPLGRQVAAGAGLKIIEGLLGKARAQDQSAAQAPGPAGSGPVRDQVMAVANRYGWGGPPQWAALDRLIQKESSWNPNAQNPRSTAYGLFQFLNSTWATVGMQKTSNPGQQAEGGLKYIAMRYGTPTRALDFHNRNNWYDDGGMLPPGLNLVMNGTGAPEPVLTGQQWNALVRDRADRGEAMSSTAVLDRLDAIADRIASAQPLIGSMTIPAEQRPREFADEVLFAIRTARRGR